MINANITSKIIKAYYSVYNELRYGFLEKVYENALLVGLLESGLFCGMQKSIKIFHHEKQVGDNYADIIVNNSVIVEIKATEALTEEHELQLVNYLRATEIEVGLLLNFGKEPEFKRKLFTNDKNKIRNNPYSI